MKKTIGKKHKNTKPNIHERFHWKYRHLTGLLAVVILSVIISSIGLDWGRSGNVPWAPDSIEGVTTVREMQNMFGQWTYKYPRGHFIINAIFYEPLLNHWEKYPINVRTNNGQIASITLNLQRLDILAKISRIIIVVMAIGTVLAVYLTAKLLYKDYLAALLSALTLALSQLFVFYSHVGNVDVPYIFWFTWGIYWAVKSVYIGKWHHYIFLGLFCSYSVCTKEPAGGYVVGLGFAVWAAMIGKALKMNKNFKNAVLSIFSVKVLVALLVFGLCFAILNGFLGGLKEFTGRMDFWGGVPKQYIADYKGQLHLLYNSVKDLYYGLGWPLLIMCIATVLYCVVKPRWEFVFGVAPLLVFYLLVIMNIRFIVPRFLLGGYPGLALLVGKTSAEWLRWEKVSNILRILPIGFIYILSLFYCIGLDLEMVEDTRVRVEQWFFKNVSRDSVIGAGIYNKIYAPRLHYAGYNLVCPWRISSVYGTSGQSNLYPEYLIIPNDWPCIDEKTENELRKQLFEGHLDYKEVASFKKKYLYPARTIFGLAGWPIRKYSFLSPELVVFKRKQESKDKPG